MTASLPTPVSGQLRNLANETTDRFGSPRPAHIAPDTVQGHAVRRVDEVVNQRQGLGSSSNAAACPRLAGDRPATAKTQALHVTEFANS